MIDTVNAAAQVFTEAAGPTKRDDRTPLTESISTLTSGPALKQMTFNWKAQDNYDKLLSFEMEVKMYS